VAADLSVGAAFFFNENVFEASALVGDAVADFDFRSAFSRSER
jgi:hypothetical protein